MSNIMKYKGYWAKIEYSEEDECFCGKVEGLKRNLISFEGISVEELKKDFKDHVKQMAMNQKNHVKAH